MRGDMEEAREDAMEGRVAEGATVRVPAWIDGQTTS